MNNSPNLIPLRKEFRDLFECFAQIDLHEWVRKTAETGIISGKISVAEFSEAVEALQVTPYVGGDPDYFNGSLYKMVREKDPEGQLKKLRYQDWFDSGQRFEWLSGIVESETKSKSGFFLSPVAHLLGSDWGIFLGIPPAEHYNYYPDTFLEFAQTETSPEGILNFANKFGFLGEHLTYGHKDSHRLELESDLYLFFEEGESFDDWVYEITKMNDYFLLWKALTNQDIDFLEKHVPKVPGEHLPNQMEFRSPGVPKRTYLAIPRTFMNPIPDPLLDDPEHRGLIALEMGFPLRNVNLKMQIKRNRLVLDMHTTSLLSEMWLDFAKNVTHGSKVVQCEHCGTWFAVGHQKNSRRDRKYCNGNCRWKAHQHRRI
jgi:Family of unknown function (DUF6076)